VLASVAAALAQEERWREAREGGFEAIEILDQTGSARLPEALSLLADLDARRGRLADAEGLRLSIWHLWERLAGSDSAVLAREYERRAELLRSMETAYRGWILTRQGGANPPGGWRAHDRFVGRGNRVDVGDGVLRRRRMKRCRD
jgi:hypothetical protein